MDFHPDLQNIYLSSALPARQPGPWESQVLGAICFAAADPVSTVELGAGPCICPALPVLDGSNSACEVWLGNTSQATVQCGAIRYRCNDAIMFGVLELAEDAMTMAVDASPLQQATESAYGQIFSLLDELQYSYIYRCWNYMADINRNSHGLERYQQFNRGRKSAFVNCGRENVEQLPAACALGETLNVAKSQLKIAFIAGRRPALAIENPRQVSAYDYPQQYGPSSPTFSRANLIKMQRGEVLLISGTASIVGHQTLHAGDVVAQTRETLSNLVAVISAANALAEQSRFDLANVFLRVYLRHATDLSLVRNELQRVIGRDVKAIFLQADICRQDLLLEMEASIFSATA